jgi:hypothetical protein
LSTKRVRSAKLAAVEAGGVVREAVTEVGAADAAAMAVEAVDAEVEAGDTADAIGNFFS